MMWKVQPRPAELIKTYRAHCLPAPFLTGTAREGGDKWVIPPQKQTHHSVSLMLRQTQHKSSSLAGATSVDSWFILCFLRDLWGVLFLCILLLNASIFTCTRSVLFFWFDVPASVVLFFWDVLTTKHNLRPSPESSQLLSRHLPLQFPYRDRFFD